MRIKAFPFGPQVKSFLDAHSKIFVVEQNRDAQLRTLLTAETGFPRDAMTPVLDYGGMPLTARIVVNAVAAQMQHVQQVPA
jgi:2-oxoglutarate ferredoxin oxidoreductase subunit alpha